MDSRLRENDEIGPAGVGSALPCLGRFANRLYGHVGRWWDAGRHYEPGRPWLGTSPSATGSPSPRIEVRGMPTQGCRLEGRLPEFPSG